MPAHLYGFFTTVFSVRFNYSVYFTRQLFNSSNTVFADFLTGGVKSGVDQKILFVIDENVVLHHPHLLQAIEHYFSAYTQVRLITEHLMVPGGEVVKNDIRYVNQVIDAVNRYGIDRHSYIAAIGGGSVLDMVGYASAISHRGIKHIRVPTTVLSQNDSGVGVKNGVNYLGKKNFLGTFAPPVLVINDVNFLVTLPDRHWRSGISEAIKVALIRDSAFFDWLELNAAVLMERDTNAMQYLIKRCAELHMQHIAGGDPFESGSSRPLDFGHWFAHKLEQITGFEVYHGEAVAIGIAVDTVYSFLSGLLSEQNCERIIRLLHRMKLPVHHTLAIAESEDSPVLAGLQEFREHLGGRLTIMLLRDIGRGEEVHEMDSELIKQSLQKLQMQTAV